MLGENIKTYRQKKGYTQEEVANRNPSVPYTKRLEKSVAANNMIAEAMLNVIPAKIFEINSCFFPYWLHKMIASVFL